MPIVGGILRDGTKVFTEDFFNGKCPDPGFPLTYIKAVLTGREWDGKPHVTGLLTGTREYYLKNVSKYFVDLDAAILAMAGTKFHENMEDDTDLTEFNVGIAGVQGTMDYLEEFPWDKTLGIVDYKLVGSFKMTKWFGITKRPVPVHDQYGNPEFYKTGARKGQPKMKNEHFVSEEAKDQFDYTMQVNIYRLAVEAMLSSKEWQAKHPEKAHMFDKKIDRMRIFFAIRDSGINHDFTFKSFFENCKKMDDETIKSFIEEKSRPLLSAMANWKAELEDAETSQDRLMAAFNNCPAMCSARETWGGKKCTSYCDVREACKKMQNMSIQEG